MEIKNKKGNVMNGVLTAVLVVVGIVILAFVSSIGASIVTTQQTSQTVNSYAYNASGQGLSGINTFAQQIPSIANIGVLVVILMLLLGAVIGYFMTNTK